MAFSGALVRPLRPLLHLSPRSNSPSFSPCPMFCSTTSSAYDGSIDSHGSQRLYHALAGMYQARGADERSYSRGKGTRCRCGIGEHPFRRTFGATALHTYLTILLLNDLANYAARRLKSSLTRAGHITKSPHPLQRPPPQHSPPPPSRVTNSTRHK
jgi:hypothetical protein